MSKFEQYLIEQELHEGLVEDFKQKLLTFFPKIKSILGTKFDDIVKSVSVYIKKPLATQDEVVDFIKSHQDYFGKDFIKAIGI